jgi:hypothetical protein
VSARRHGLPKTLAGSSPSRITQRIVGFLAGCAGALCYNVFAVVF